MKKIQRTSVHLANGTYAKLQYIAETEKRTMDEQVLLLIHTCIKAYEAEHGEIQPRKDE